jgi:hypothetical protein
MAIQVKRATSCMISRDKSYNCACCNAAMRFAPNAAVGMGAIRKGRLMIACGLLTRRTAVSEFTNKKKIQLSGKQPSPAGAIGTIPPLGEEPTTGAAKSASEGTST